MNNIPTHNLDRTWWTLDTLSSQLGQIIKIDDLKACAFLPDSFSFNDLEDEKKRPAKKHVFDAITTNYNDSDIFYLSLQTYEGHSYIIAHHNNGTHYWYWFDQNKDGLENALKQLLDQVKQSIYIIPTGDITLTVREISQQRHSYIIATEQSYNATAILEIYHENIDVNPQTSQDNTAIAQQNTMTHLDYLEAESIHIIREVAAQANNPVMLYSVGKDSAVMLHLAKKAFYPATPPFPLLHVDTGWKFQSMYDYRDTVAKETGMDLIIHQNPEGVEKNINPFDHGSAVHTDIMKTQGLKQALDKYGFDFAFGGARRDEEKSRAKERIFSFRTKTHHWDPKNQRPELWNLYNCNKADGESIRVFPLSNWTELDIWQYIYRENIKIVPLYFAKQRPIIEKNGMTMMVDDDRLPLDDSDHIEMRQVRFRTLGCYPLTGAIESDASDVPSIIVELLETRLSERQGRAIDHDNPAAIEKKKKEGYF